MLQMYREIWQRLNAAQNERQNDKRHRETNHREERGQEYSARRVLFSAAPHNTRETRECKDEEDDDAVFDERNADNLPHISREVRQHVVEHKCGGETSETEGSDHPSRGHVVAQIPHLRHHEDQRVPDAGVSEVRARHSW
jgi:hypothetical protein